MAQKRSRRRRAVVAAVAASGMPALALAIYVGGLGRARSADAPLQHTLRAIGCVNPLFRRTSQQNGATIYRLECSRGRIVTVVCAERTCRVSSSDREEDDP